MPRELLSTGSSFEAEVGYSRAVVQGDWCFMAGVTGYDYATMTLPDGIAAQAEACFATVRDVLDRAGFAFEDIVRVTHFLSDRALMDDLVPVIARHIRDVRPASTMVIAGLMTPEMLYEVEVTALRRA